MNIVIIGATSAIAHGVAKKYCSQKNSVFYLVGRSQDKLNAIADDLRVRGAQQVYTDACLFTDVKQYQTLFSRILASMKTLDIVLIAHGSLTHQERAEQDPLYTFDELHTNFTSVVGLGVVAAEQCKKQRSGTIAIIGSVAGERGRQSNYLYGAAKAGVTAFCSGLRNRLMPFNVHVLTILPGFVDTPMTAEIPKNFLFAKADDVGAAIVNAIEKKKNVLYTPFFWLYIMTIVKIIPEFIYKRLKT